VVHALRGCEQADARRTAITKHIALRSRSVHNPDKAYTTPGLGDRIHSCTVAWVYSQAHDTPVTLHLTAEKWAGGQFANKPESWAEIVSLFPRGTIGVQPHEVGGLTDAQWLAYLQAKGIDAEFYWYGDFPGKFETPVDLDIAPYLRCIPLLQAEAQNIELPERFITVQWDSNQARRTIAPEKRPAVLAQYPFPPVVVGGEATQKHLGWSLKHIAFAMSRADLHVGVDSAFFHLAQLYMPPERIHLYNEPEGFFSHHALRHQAQI